MRNKIQKYLSGEREGFSLVELIIVIAIMAILIGVVALAVIPYLNKSRESKDLQALNNVLSALTSSVGTTKAQGSGTITIADGDTVSNGTVADGSGTASGTTQKVLDAMEEVLGNATIDMQSSNADGNSIICTFDSATNKMSVKVNTTDTTSDGDPYEVTNG
ncbi:MAG: type II secretion system GspH family protein [Eubacterium sp.]|nr:type II secretion system GspH family protein [Eubacterium sp.]